MDGKSEDLTKQLRAGNRAALARAITLVESRAEKHFHTAQMLLQDVMPQTGRAVRLGISGVPGVGKSTFIDAFGSYLTAQGHRVAVLAVDPSSNRTGGSILGDKTRMPRLAVDERAFIRPSPSSGVLGGVAAATRETILLCEAAGYDVILVETVGTGQSETAVATMVDHFLLLMLPGAGDDLQGIKKGILELAHIIAVNKADADRPKAERAARDLRAALTVLGGRPDEWQPPILLCSGLVGDGLEAIWGEVTKHRTQLKKSGALHARRREQRLHWLWALMEARLMVRLKSSRQVRAHLPDIEAEVAEGRLPPSLAADRLLGLFLGEGNDQAE